MKLLEILNEGWQKTTRAAKTAATAATIGAASLGAQDAQAQQLGTLVGPTCSIGAEECTPERAEGYIMRGSNVDIIPGYALGADTIPVQLRVPRLGDQNTPRDRTQVWVNALGNVGAAWLLKEDGDILVAGPSEGAYEEILLQPADNQKLGVQGPFADAHQGRTTLRIDGRQQSGELFKFTGESTYTIETIKMLQAKDCEECYGVLPARVVLGPQQSTPQELEHVLETLSTGEPQGNVTIKMGDVYNTINNVINIQITGAQADSTKPQERPQEGEKPEDNGTKPPSDERRSFENFYLSGGLLNNWTGGIVQNTSGIQGNRILEETQNHGGFFAKTGYTNELTSGGVRVTRTTGTYSQEQERAEFIIDADLETLAVEGHFARTLGNTIGIGTQVTYTLDESKNVRTRGMSVSEQSGVERKELIGIVGPTLTGRGANIMVGAGGYRRTFTEEPAQTGVAFGAGVNYQDGPFVLDASLMRSGEQAMRIAAAAGVNLTFKGIGVYGGLGVERRTADEQSFQNKQTKLRAEIGGTYHLGRKR